MVNSNSSCIFLGNSPITINGGFRHPDPDKGFKVEVQENKQVRSIPFNELTFASETHAEKTFIQLFGISFEEARRRSKANFMPTIMPEIIAPDEKIVDSENGNADGIFFVSLEELPENVLETKTFDPNKIRIPKHK